jgi:hypothetical protein
LEFPYGFRTRRVRRGGITSSIASKKPVEGREVCLVAMVGCEVSMSGSGERLPGRCVAEEPVSCLSERSWVVVGDDLAGDVHRKPSCGSLRRDHWDAARERV